MPRRLLLSLGLLVPLCFSALPGCDGGSSTGGEEGFDPNGGGTSGVGDPCGTGGKVCRLGLTCGAMSTCELTHSLDTGSNCQLNGQCKQGLQCDFATKTCQAGGTGADGDACKSDADCGTGLRCNLVGFSAACAPEGKGDLGKTCLSSADCLGGLGCAAGKCASVPGVPPYGIAQFPGVECGEDTGGPASYFRVPRGSDDGDFFRLPFPNDIRTKGGKPDYTGHPTPGTALLGFDPVDRYIQAMANDDGWSANPTVLFRFTETPDVKSVQDRLTFVDVSAEPEPFEHGWQMLLSGGRGKYVCKNWLGVRRPDGDPLWPGHTYAVFLTKGVTGASGEVARAPDFDAVMSDTVPGDAALAAAHTAYAPFREWLKKKGKDQSTILTAAVFTVGKVTAPAEKIAKTVKSLPVPAATDWVKCGSGPSPCSDTTGNRACGADNAAFDEYHALITLPIFQAGKAPYKNPEDGGNIDTSGDAAVKVRDEQVCAALSVPKGAMPGTPTPVVLYAHGTGGSFRSHINEGVAAALAGAATPMAVLGIDQVSHGPRRGESKDSPNNLFFNFTNPGAARGNPLQGGADQMSLARYLAAGAGLPFTVDPKAVLYWGHSQGATEGGIAVSYIPEISGAVFSGQGASIVDALLSKKSPVNIAGALPFALMDVDTGTGGLYSGPFHPELAIMQAYIDPADPLHFAPLFAERTPMGMTPHHVFQVYGLGDTYSPPATEAAFAVAAQEALVESSAATGAEAELGGVPAVKAPLSGNKSPQGDGKTYTCGTRKYAPASGKDGHFVAFDDATAKEDVARFLVDLAQGKVPRIGQ